MSRSMSSSKIYSHLEKLYTEFESKLPLEQLENHEAQSLTTFNGNKLQPIHRWFTFKEGFSSTLLHWVAHKLNIPQNGSFSVLDPFCGVATSLLSAQLENNPSLNNLTGIEINPFIAWVAETKLNWYLYDIKKIKTIIPDLIKLIKSRRKLNDAIPSLSTINNPNYFERDRLENLILARDMIKTNVSCPEQNFFLLGWSGIIETSSNLRKDGRALRFVPSKEHKPVYQLLEEQWRLMLDDLKVVPNFFHDRNSLSVTPAKILKQEDGRTLSGLKNNSIQYDLIIYSPPYPNNIDYSEVYKLELWFNEFVTNQQEFKQLRLCTLRSHPSVKFPETNFFEKLNPKSWPVKLLNVLIDTLPQDKDLSWRVRLIRGYVEDMLISLQNQYRVMKKGGYGVCVVGNSVHGSSTHKFCIAADIIISAIAQEVGFQTQDLIVAREFTRRNFTSPFNRESILIFRK